MERISDKILLMSRTAGTIRFSDVRCMMSNNADNSWHVHNRSHIRNLTGTLWSNWWHWSSSSSWGAQGRRTAKSGGSRLCSGARYGWSRRSSSSRSLRKAGAGGSSSSSSSSARPNATADHSTGSRGGEGSFCSCGCSSKWCRRHSSTGLVDAQSPARPSAYAILGHGRSKASRNGWKCGCERCVKVDARLAFAVCLLLLEGREC